LSRDDGHFHERRNASHPERAQSSLVFPVGIVVVVAFICIIIAAVTSARRADEVAIEQETQLFTTALRSHALRMLREVRNVSTQDRAVEAIAGAGDPQGPAARIGENLKRKFGYDFVFVVDGNGRILYPNGESGPDPAAFRQNLAAVVDLLRGGTSRPAAPFRILPGAAAAPIAAAQAMLLQVFAGRPALVAGAAMMREPAALPGMAPVVLAVRYIDNDILAEIAGLVQLRHLRMLVGSKVDVGDHLHDVIGMDGRSIARFAWAPRRPGAEIVASVFPFITVAFFGFLLLAAFVWRQMRRTARTIDSTEKRLRHLAMHDPLCGLPNRIYFSERLENMIREVHEGGAPAAVFYIDLDHFKDVNDILGHPVGDELIGAVATRLSRVMRESDVVARLGGDEFAVIRTVDSGDPALHAIAERIISTLCAPYALAEQSIIIGASVGIAVIDRNSAGAADVMRHADMALYRAKNEGRNRACIFDAAMDADLVQRKLLQDDLRQAIFSDGLRLEYQPVVNTSGEKVIGVEALARWQHPVHGEISPGEFIPIAERSGLIIELGNWVLHRACYDGCAWPNLTVAVNVSPLQFRRADFVEVVERTLAETGFDPARLELEITESTLLGNVDGARAAMLRLKGLGVKLALDDFGTGYSSLQYLRRLPFDRIKIDHSFVRSIESTADAAAIVHAIVSLGRGLGMKVTAEGVETAEQQLFLRAAGVHAMQGYRFGRPVPGATVAEYNVPVRDKVVGAYAIAR
jgi:diguanylate cyclase (GGDEF)-like protein